MTNNLSYYIYLPENLELDKVIYKDPSILGLMKNPTHARDRLFFLTGQISNAIRSRQGRGINQKLVPIYAHFLQRFDRSYKRYYEYLLKHEIIDCDETFFSNEWAKKCKYYGFADKYVENQEWRKHYFWDQKFIEAIYTSQRDPIKVREYDYLYRWFEHLTFDEEKMNGLLDTHAKNDLACSMQQTLLDRLKNGKCWTFRQGFTGRLYTPITNIQSEVRQNLGFNMQDLYTIDIKNSIPYFALTLLDFPLINENNEIKERLVEANKCKIRSN